MSVDSLQTTVLRLKVVTPSGLKFEVAPQRINMKIKVEVTMRDTTGNFLSIYLI